MRPEIRCPHCLENIDLAQHLREEGWRRLMLTLGGLGSAWRLALDYLLLFRRGPGRMPMRAMQRAAEELVGVARSGRLDFDRRSYRVERHQIEAALARVVDSPPQSWPGFRNNNYLWRVLVPLLQEQRRADVAAEAARESARRARAGTSVEPTRLAGPESEEPERPIWELPPEKLIVAMATAYRAPLAMSVMRETVGRMAESLLREGVDLDRLRSVAARLPEGFEADPGIGARLLKECRRAGSQAPIGECLPKEVRNAGGGKADQG